MKKKILMTIVSSTAVICGCDQKDAGKQIVEILGNGNYDNLIDIIKKCGDKLGINPDLVDDVVAVLNGNTYEFIKKFNEDKISLKTMEEKMTDTFQQVDPANPPKTEELIDLLKSSFDNLEIAKKDDTPNPPLGGPDDGKPKPDEPQKDDTDDLLKRLENAYKTHKASFVKEETDQYKKLYNWLCDFVKNKKLNEPKNIVELFEKCDAAAAAREIMAQIYSLTDYNTHNNEICKNALGNNDVFVSFDGVSIVKYNLILNDQLTILLQSKYSDKPLSLSIDDKKTVFGYVWLNKKDKPLDLKPITTKLNQQLAEDQYNPKKQGLKLDNSSTVTTLDYLKQVDDFVKNIDSYTTGNELGDTAKTSINEAIKDYLLNNLKTVVNESLKLCSDKDNKIKFVNNDGIKDLIINLFNNVWDLGGKSNISIESTNDNKIDKIIILSAKNKMDDDLVTKGYDLSEVCDKLKDYLNDTLVQGDDAEKTIYEIASIASDDFSNIETIKNQLNVSTNGFNENLLNDKVKICDIETELGNLKTTLSQPINQPFDTTNAFVLSSDNTANGNGLVKVIANIKAIYDAYNTVKSSVGLAGLSPKETDLVNAILKIYYGNDIADVKTRKTILGFHLGTDGNADDSLFCCISKTGIAQYILNENLGADCEEAFKNIWFKMVPAGTKFKDKDNPVTVVTTVIGYNNTPKKKNLYLNELELSNNMCIRIPLNLVVVDPKNDTGAGGYKVCWLHNNDEFSKDDQILGDDPYTDTPGIAQILGLLGDIDQDSGDILGNYEFTVARDDYDGNGNYQDVCFKDQVPDDVG